MTLADFVANSLGQCIDSDGAFGCQCVDLADAWADALGRPLPRVAGAKDLAGTAPPGWRWIGNRPANAPQPGDLVVWDSRIGPFGHIALCVGPADASSFRSLDENWYGSNGVTGSPAAFVTHGYFGVAGWLRPLPAGGHPMTLPAVPFNVVTRDGHWFDHPNGSQMGPFAAGIPLHVVETAQDPGNGWEWCRADLGAWWFVGATPAGPADADVVAPPAVTTPPPDAFAARLLALENWRTEVKAALTT